MPFLNNIVQSINDNLRATSLKGSRFQDSQLYCIAKPALVTYKDDVTKLVPVIFSDLKEIDVTADDQWDLMLYHRVISCNYVEARGFGNDNDIIERANMLMVVYADPERLNINQEDLSFLCVAGLPATRFNTTNADNPNANITGVIIPGTVNHNSFQVFSGEYQSTGYPLKPQSIYFSVQYTIETTANRNCLNCFDC